MTHSDASLKVLSLCSSASNDKDRCRGLKLTLHLEQGQCQPSWNFRQPVPAIPTPPEPLSQGGRCWVVSTAFPQRRKAAETSQQHLCDWSSLWERAHCSSRQALWGGHFDTSWSPSPLGKDGGEASKCPSLLLPLGACLLWQVSSMRQKGWWGWCSATSWLLSLPGKDSKGVAKLPLPWILESTCCGWQAPRDRSDGGASTLYLGHISCQGKMAERHQRADRFQETGAMVGYMLALPLALYSESL